MVTMQRLLLAFAAALLFASVANADSSPFNNLSASSDGADTVVLAAPLADSFSTGANPFNLASVTVELETGSLQALVPGAFSSPNGSVTMTLLSNAVGPTPGMVLDTIGTLSDSSVTSSLADYLHAFERDRADRLPAGDWRHLFHGQREPDDRSELQYQLRIPADNRWSAE